MIAANRGLNFSPPIQDFVESRLGSGYTALCGGNNSGKSLVLKNLKVRLGRDAYMAGAQRFYHVHEISTQRFNDADYDNWSAQFANQANNEEFNSEQNFMDLGRIIGGMKDAKRDKLFELCGTLVGSKFSLKRRDEENELSLRYVDMDGQSLAVGSTGTRLLMTLLGLCMDEKFSVMLIDEPELGLSPRVQAALSAFLSDEQQRREYFPKLSQICVATHSHLFLDRRQISNNFVVSKSGRDVSISKITSMEELHRLQFNMLGNSLESLFLPSAVVIVEGKTDKPYFERVINLKFPNRKIIVIESQGDVKRVFNSFCQSVGDFQKSPFRPRAFVILDSVHTPGTKDTLTRMGAKPENVVVWNRNGVEYIYPPACMCEIFGCAANELGQLTIAEDIVSLNGIQRRKEELAREVVGRLSPETELPPELMSKLLEPLARSIGD